VKRGARAGTIAPPRFTTSLAESAFEVLEAQRLRYRAYRDALRTDHPAHALGLDRDAFDDHCEHLLVRDGTSGAVVGTYRILDAEGARAAGGFYTASEFDLHRVLRLPGRLVEVGRACVDPDHRSGGVIATLLAGLAHHLFERRYDYVFGCASVSVAADPAAADALCRRLARSHLGPEEWRVFPHVPFVLDASPASEDAPLPPLVKGYLRLGALVCGAPAWDPQFRTADLPLMLPLATMAPRWRHRLTRPLC
jgi:putative hemolysin